MSLAPARLDPNPNAVSPRPWKVEFDPVHGFVVVVDRNGKEIARAGGETVEQRQSNAKIIASALEVLDTLGDLTGLMCEVAEKIPGMSGALWRDPRFTKAGELVEKLYPLMMQKLRR